jgi:aminopeptidase N
MRTALLELIAAANPEEGIRLARVQFENADNMTDRMGAMAVLIQHPGDAREKALASFYDAFEADALVMDKWFALQGSIAEGDTLARVRTLMTHKLFSMKNPNRMRSLIGSFAGNPTQFHRADGSGYNFLTEIVLELDPKNPQIAARLLGALRSWRTLEAKRRSHAEAALRHVAANRGLSPDVRDIVDRSLS